MNELVELLEGAQVVAFGVVAMLVLRRWISHRAPTAMWAAVAFAVLGGVVVFGRFVPDDGSTWGSWAQKGVVAALALFPYSLHRFAATFRPPRRIVEIAARMLTAAAGLGIFLIGDLPEEGESGSTAVVVYSIVVLAQWALVSTMVAGGLWRAGSDRSTVVRHRMRTLSAGTVALLVALLLAVAAQGADGSGAGIADVLVALLALVSGPLFLVGFAPPSFVLAIWRSEEEAAMYEAESALVAATDTAEIARGLLPHVVAITGASRAVLLAPEGAEIAQYSERPHAISSDDTAVMQAPMRFGSLAIESDMYTPFFGRDVATLLHRLAALTDVALQRADLAERDRALTAELAASNRAIREFVGVASHDLRTPIAVLKGYAALLVSGGDSISDEERVHHLAVMVRQADHLSNIVNDLLMVSRLDGGVVDPEPEPARLADTVEHIATDLRLQDQMSVEVDSSLVVFVDPDHLSRMLRNLIENARVHGAPPFEVVATLVNGMAEIVVRDHGEGVESEFVPRLFERFTRGSSARTGGRHGTGLGLPIVHGLAQAAGGDLRYEAASPGSSFVLTLPLTTQERP
ncbi:MAG: HAMP domain-containing histidine kinase [Acidimicrobiia bacterium]|nr:HAMP domain-containing histidine kinase [Acidimicrobiia bacterium]